MIEKTQYTKFILRHPIKPNQLVITFYDNKMMDDWLPYLNRFEEYLIQKAIKNKKQ